MNKNTKAISRLETIAFASIYISGLSEADKKLAAENSNIILHLCKLDYFYILCDGIWNKYELHR